MLPDFYRNLHVLIVDDMAPVRTLIRGVLRQIGAGVISEAANARDAFDAVRAQPPDVVITDWHMPGGSGLDLLGRIRHDRQSPDPLMPVILLTARGDMERVKNARDAGATDFLVKPVAPKTIVARLRATVEAPRMSVLAPGYLGPDRRRAEPGLGADERRGTAEEEAVFLEPSSLLLARISGDEKRVARERQRVETAFSRYTQIKRRSGERDIEDLCSKLEAALQSYSALEGALGDLAVSILASRDRALAEGRTAAAAVLASLAGVLSEPFTGASTARRIHLHLQVLPAARKCRDQAATDQLLADLARELEP